MQLAIARHAKRQGSATLTDGADRQHARWRHLVACVLCSDIGGRAIERREVQVGAAGSGGLEMGWCLVPFGATFRPFLLRTVTVCPS